MAAKRQKPKSKKPLPAAQSRSPIRAAEGAQYGRDNRRIWIRVAVPGFREAPHNTGSAAIAGELKVFKSRLEQGAHTRRAQQQRGASNYNASRSSVLRSFFLYLSRGQRAMTLSSWNRAGSA